MDGIQNQKAPDRFDLLTASIFFTPILFIFTVIILFFALLYGQKDLSTFCIVLIVLAACLKLWSVFSVRNIICRSAIDRTRLFPGEKTVLNINIMNKKLLPVLIKIRLFIDDFLRNDTGEEQIKVKGGLLWYQGMIIQRGLTAQKRGIYRIGSPVLTTGDFFGFFSKDRFEAQELDIIVYPKRVPIKPFPLIKRILFGKPGTASPVCDPVYMLGTRNYQQSSPARYIHWKASARHNRLQEKIFEPAEQDKVLLVLDGENFYENEAYDEFEHTVEVLASLAAELTSQNYATGFITNCTLPYKKQDNKTDCLNISGSPGHLSAMLEVMAGIQIRTLVKMTAVFKRFGNSPSNAVCVYFSYHHSDTIRFNGKKIPTVHIICEKKSFDTTKIKHPDSNHLYYLRDICLTV